MSPSAAQVTVYSCSPPDARDPAEQLGRGKRKKRAINRFTPEARKARALGSSTSSSSSSSSSSAVPAPRRGQLEVERRLAMDSSSS